MGIYLSGQRNRKRGREKVSLPLVKAGSSEGLSTFSEHITCRQPWYNCAGYVSHILLSDDVIDRDTRTFVQDLHSKNPHYGQLAIFVSGC